MYPAAPLGSTANSAPILRLAVFGRDARQYIPKSYPLVRPAPQSLRRRDQPHYFLHTRPVQFLPGIHAGSNLELSERFVVAI